jgi:AcrR family transcriptional regulator
MHITEKAEPLIVPQSKRQRTRNKLIQCAIQIVGEKGFERTTLEEVAKRAGLTRGSIYGNFQSRNELFLAVAESQWEPVAPVFPEGASLEDQLRLLADAVIEQLPQRRQRAVGAASFVAYALTHQELRKKLAKANAHIYRTLAPALHASELTIPPESFVKTIHALIEGIFVLNALTPELVDADTVRHAFRVLTQSRKR